MNIMYKPTAKKVRFKNVRYGQAFELDSCAYIKTECKAVLLHDIAGLAAINAVGLFGGIYSLVDDDEEVILYEKAKVVLI